LGYSARYHAASLVAVFLALAVGILIGAGLGDNLVASTEDNLRESLEGDIESARGEADELQTQLDRERAFSERAYPALVSNRLAGEDIGILALGDLSPALSSDIEAALEPTGADLSEVAVVRRPANVSGIASELGPKSAKAVQEDPAELEDVGQVLGTNFAQGGQGLLGRVRDNLFSRTSGEGGRLDGVILTRASTEDLSAEDRANSDALERGLAKGVAESGATGVAVERSDAGDSQVAFFEPLDVATVDDVDLTSGKVALVFALLGAKSSFGIKDSADSLLPELLIPARGNGR
jgi:hypothetical protein